MIKDPDLEADIPNTATENQALWTFRDSDNQVMAELWWDVKTKGLYLVMKKNDLHPSINGATNGVYADSPKVGVILTCHDDDGHFIMSENIIGNNCFFEAKDCTLLYPDFKKGIVFNLSQKYNGVIEPLNEVATGNTKVMMAVDTYG